jgi:DnaJ-class molecular chaperone
MKDISEILGVIVVVKCKCGDKQQNCPECNGTRKVERLIGYEAPMREEMDCPTCLGLGKVDCSICKGTGKRVETITIEEFKEQIR